MFVKELRKTLHHVRVYPLYSKNQYEGSVMINIKHVPKISLFQNTICFHLPQPQIITYENPLDAETEYHTIHHILHSS
jgi:hypothetical protein